MPGNPSESDTLGTPASVNLTLPVTSASCEWAHSKVDIVKSAVRASMTSERLEDLVLISSEKGVLDTINISVIIDKFAAVTRALPL